MNLADTPLNGDSTVSGLEFVGGWVAFTYEDSETDRLFRVRVQASVVYASGLEGEANVVSATCRPLRDYLEVQQPSDRYVLHSDFVRQMEASRRYYHLAVGLPASKYKGLFVLQGTTILLATPVLGPEAILIESRIRDS